MTELARQGSRLLVAFLILFEFTVTLSVVHFINLDGDSVTESPRFIINIEPVPLESHVLFRIRSSTNRSIYHETVFHGSQQRIITLKTPGNYSLEAAIVDESRQPLESFSSAPLRYVPRGHSSSLATLPFHFMELLRSSVVLYHRSISRNHSEPKLREALLQMKIAIEAAYEDSIDGSVIIAGDTSYAPSFALMAGGAVELLDNITGVSEESRRRPIVFYSPPE